MVRIALQREARAADQVDDTLGGEELRNEVLRVGVDEVRGPLEVAGLDVLRRQGEFETVGFHLSDVTVLLDLAADTRGVRDGDQVVVVTPVHIAHEVDAVVEEAQFNAQVELMLLFEGEIRVGEVVNPQGGLLVEGGGTPAVRSGDHHVGVGHPARAAFSGQGVGSLEGGVGKDRLERTHPLLVGEVPTAGHVPGREPAGGTGLTEAVGTLVTDGAVQAVTSLVRISGGAEEGRAALVGVLHREVVGVLLGAFLEDAVVVVGDFTHGVLETPAAEPDLVTVHGVDLHTAIAVDHVVAEVLGEVTGQTHVPTLHPVVGALEDTAVREDGLRKGESDVRIRVQEGVVVPDGRRVGGAIGLSLVGTVQDVVLTSGTRVLVGGEGGQFELTEHLPLEFALHADVRHIQVQVVVLQFIQNVERCVVTGVVLVGIQRAGSVERVGVRVDIEVTLHLTGDGIQGRTQGTRRTLRTVGSVSDHVQGNVMEKPVGGVDVRGETLDGALQGPTRVIHHGQGGVVVARVRTARHGDGVVVLDIVGEELVEPVRVAVLGGAEVSGLRGVGVREAELTAGLVELGNQLIHLTIDTAVGGVGRTGIQEVTLLLQFLVDGHLVLGVHDVELGVHRLQTDRIFSVVSDAAGAGATLLGRDDDNAGHGARTVDGGRGTVLEDIEALDIVGVQTGDGGRDQGIGVTGAQVFRVDIDNVFHDDTVHDPQRLGGTVDGGRTTDADLRSGTERTGNVLDGDTGHAAFQGTRNIRDTADLGVFGVQFDGRTGKQTPVDLGHTRDDRLFQHLRIRIQDNAEVVLHRNSLILEAHEGCNEVLGALGNLVQDKVTVQVCHGSNAGGTFHIHVRSDDRLSVISGDHRTTDRPSLRKSGRHSQEEGTYTEQMVEQFASHALRISNKQF